MSVPDNPDIMFYNEIDCWGWRNFILRRFFCNIFCATLSCASKLKPVFCCFIPAIYLRNKNILKTTLFLFMFHQMQRKSLCVLTVSKLFSIHSKLRLERRSSCGTWWEPRVSNFRSSRRTRGSAGNVSSTNKMAARQPANVSPRDEENVTDQRRTVRAAHRGGAS